MSDYCVENGLVDIYSGSETAEKNEAPKMLLMSAAAPKKMLGSAPEPTKPDGIVIKANENGTYTFTMPAYPVTVTAEFEEAPLAPENYTVTFNMNGHGTQIASQTVKAGSKATKPAADPVEGGYIFDGWYTEKALLNRFDFGSAIKEDTTLYAKWTPLSPVPGRSNPATGCSNPDAGNNDALRLCALFLSGCAVLTGTVLKLIKEN